MTTALQLCSQIVYAAVPADYTAEANNAYAEAERIKDHSPMQATSSYSRAAIFWTAAAARMEENETNKGRRGTLIFQALNSFKQAFSLSPQRCDILEDAKRHTSTYRDELIAVYGDSAQSLLEYQRNADFYSQFIALLEECARLQSGNIAGPDKGPPASPPQQEKPLQASPSQTQPAKNTESYNYSKILRRHKIAIGVSAGVTIAFTAVALATALPRVREPFEGSTYRDIYNAAVDSWLDDDENNDIPFSTNVDMCDDRYRDRNTDVDAACAKWRHLGTASLITGIAAGVTGILMVGTVGSLISHKRKHRDRINVNASFGSGAYVFVQYRF